MKLINKKEHYEQLHVNKFNDLGKLFGRHKLPEFSQEEKHDLSGPALWILKKF